MQAQVLRLAAGLGIMVVAAPVQGIAAPSSEADGRAEQVLAQAERAAAKAPRDVRARTRLAQAYLKDGRFVAAGKAFEQAVALGDSTPATGLGLALAYIGSGQNAQGREVLERYRQNLPAADYALALSLAGEPAQGVTILSGLVGQPGADLARVRQNLAYAYALDGRWREARVVASQDVPADQLDARMQQWATPSGPSAARVRVASLLGVPVREEAEAVANAATVPNAPAVRHVAVAPVAIVSHSTQRVPPSLAPKGNSPSPIRLAGGTHAVQLGSYGSQRNAQRALEQLSGSGGMLAGHDLRIAAATVKGKQLWRLTAGGFDAVSARSVCAAQRGRGGVCLPFRTSSPGAPAKEQLAQR